MKENALPREIRVPNLDRKIEILFSKWDEDVAFDIPLTIRSKFGVR